MNPPLFDLSFALGPFDGWQVTTNYLPTDSLALPTRPDRAATLRSACRHEAVPHSRAWQAHYRLAHKQLVLIHGIPVVRMHFRFQKVSRPQAERRTWLQWLRKSVTRWVDRGRRSISLPGAVRMGSPGGYAGLPAGFRGQQ